ILALLLGALSSSSYSSGPQHHGFFLRMDLGLGYFNSTASGTTLSGAGGGLGISIGGNIADNLALFGSLFDAVAVNPNVSGPGGSGSTSDTSVGIGGAGSGRTYYVL